MPPPEGVLSWKQVYSTLEVIRLKTGFSSCVGGRGMCIYLSSSQLFGFPSFKTSAKYSIYGVILGMEGKTTLEADTHTS